MSYIDIASLDAQAVRSYEEDAYYEKYYNTAYGILMESGAMYVAPELNGAQVGDYTTINLFGKLGGIGFGEDQTIVGNENSRAVGSFSMAWNELYNAEKVPSESNVKQMRIRQDLFEGAIDGVFDWHKDRFAYMVHNQGGGNNATSITIGSDVYTGNDLQKITGHNAAAALSSNRAFRPNAVANDQSLGASDTLSLDDLDDVVSTIQTITASVPEFQWISEEIMAIGFVHPKVMNLLKRDQSGTIQWYPNALAKLQGGMGNDLENVIGYREGYVYNNLLLFADPRVPNGVHSSSATAVSNTYRSVFYGKNALVGGSPYGLSLDDNDVPLQLAQETFDYARFRGVAGGSKLGVKTFVGVEGEANNVFTITSYAA